MKAVYVYLDGASFDVKGENILFEENGQTSVYDGGWNLIAVFPKKAVVIVSELPNVQPLVEP